ncbi:MAG TPA: lipopolysaccharide biosynthesis protein [Longimicrobium sp.]|jgi:PST family polysaccharide transporter
MIQTDRSAPQESGEARPPHGSEGTPPGGLAQRTMSAARWKFASAVCQGIFQFAVGVLLARLLPPDDFGVVALAMVVVGFAALVGDLGLGPAVVQSRTLTPLHLRTAFTASLLLGAALTLVLLALAPLSASLLRSPELPGVLRLQSAAFVCGALGVTARAVLQRRLDFRRLFVVELASYTVGYAGVAAGMALMGYGVWSLAWGALVQSLLGSAIALAMVRHSVRPRLSSVELRQLFAFGAGVSLNNVINYVARNGDNLIVGRWLGATALGLYGRAYNLMMLPLTYLGAVGYSVMFPAMAAMQDDRERLGRAYLISVQVTAFLTAPIMAGMIVAAPHMVRALYGGRWAAMVLPLQVLCAAGFFRAVYHLAGAFTHASGKVYSETARQVVYAACVVIGGAIGTRWGILGVAVGVSLAIVQMYLAMASLVLGLAGLRWADFVVAQLPGVVLSLLVGGAALVARLALERLGLGSGAIFLGILAACALTVPAGVYLLPRRVRPVALFARLTPALGRLPAPLPRWMGTILRLTPG